MPPLGPRLVVVLTLVSVVALFVTWLSDRALRKMLDRPAASPGDVIPGVSVLKPVKGLDDGLFENLSSFARQSHPRFEILIGAADAADPALDVARAVAAANPGVTLRIFVCPPDGGLNPKVSTLRVLAGQARHDQILISDSNVRVAPDYLVVTAAELRDPNVGLVTNPIGGVGAGSYGAHWENHHLAAYVARALALAAMVGHACVVGKSMLFRRSQFRMLGGWRLVRDVLAEDYVIGEAYERAGYRVAVSPHVISTYNQGWPVARFFNRHLRWAQMRRQISLGVFLFEPLFNPNAWLIALLLTAAATDVAPRLVIPAALAGIAGRLLLDRATWTRLSGAPPPVRALLLCVVKDLVVTTLWPLGGLKRTISWRGHRLRLCAGTRLERLEDGGDAADDLPAGAQAART